MEEGAHVDHGGAALVGETGKMEMETFRQLFFVLYELYMYTPSTTVEAPPPPPTTTLAPPPPTTTTTTLAVAAAAPPAPAPLTTTTATK